MKLRESADLQMNYFKVRTLFCIRCNVKKWRKIKEKQTKKMVEEEKKKKEKKWRPALRTFPTTFLSTMKNLLS